MTHKEFYFWLQGFLNGKTSLTTEEIFAIQKKMEKIKEEDEIDYSDFLKKKNLSQFFNPIQVKIVDDTNDDDLGKPPKIVM